jgi:osomolarity two-component system sensor histidine kinase SLN1
VARERVLVSRSCDRSSSLAGAYVLSLLWYLYHCDSVNFQRLGLISHTGEASGSTFWVELPFGVGAKALVGLPSQQQALLRTPSKRRGPPPPTPVDAAQQRRMNSAMHGLMDQAGLVELAPVGASAAVITRTLGDPSTGTHTPAFGTLRLDVLARPPLQSLEHMSEMTVVGTPDVITISPDLSAVDVAVATVTAKVKAANAETVEVITPEKPSQEPLEVLVVDDDPLTRTLMKRLLSRLGCSVSTADNGEAAIQLVLARPAKDPYAVVFLDNQMPVMTGVEAVASLREAGRHDFMVGVTGNALLSDQAEYLAAGIDQYVQISPDTGPLFDTPPSVLTKPVLERNLRAMLLKAEERMLLLATKSRES